MSQADDILDYLREHPDGISPVEALELFGCMRLAARISDIRAAGHDVIAVNESHKGGTHARYKLHQVANGTPAVGADIREWRRSPHYRYRHWQLVNKTPGCVWCDKAEEMELIDPSRPYRGDEAMPERIWEER